MLKHLLVGVAGVGLLLGPGAHAEQETLTINSFGGTYEELHQELVIKPFEAMHNVKVNVVTAYSGATMAQVRAQKDNPQFDVVHFSGGQEVPAAEEGLIVSISPSQLTNFDDLYPFAREGMARGEGPVYQLATIGLLYHEERIKQVPSSWKDLWNPEYRGYMVLTDISNSYGLLGLLMINRAFGGTLDNIQPGLDAVGELLPHAILVDKGPHVEQHFAQSGTKIAPFAQDYAYNLRQRGLPVQFVQPVEGSAAVYITANVVAGRPNTDLAIKFVDFMLRPEAQTGFAEGLRYSPANEKAVLRPEVAKDVIYGEEQVVRLVRFSPKKVSANRSAWTDAWNRLIAK